MFNFVRHFLLTVHPPTPTMGRPHTLFWEGVFGTFPSSANFSEAGLLLDVPAQLYHLQDAKCIPVRQPGYFLVSRTKAKHEQEGTLSFFFRLV